jgi:hypothetical protein
MMRSFQYERRPRIFNTSSRTHLTEGATISISLSRLAPNTPPAKPLNHQLPVFLVLAYLIFMHKDPVPAERSVTARHLTSLVWPHAISSRNLRADGEYRTRGSTHHRGYLSAGTHAHLIGSPIQLINPIQSKPIQLPLDLRTSGSISNVHAYGFCRTQTCLLRTLLRKRLGGFQPALVRVVPFLRIYGIRLHSSAVLLRIRLPGTRIGDY